MTDQQKIEQGTPEWFHMVGRTLVEAASRASLPHNMNLSFVEPTLTGARSVTG